MRVGRGEAWFFDGYRASLRDLAFVRVMTAGVILIVKLPMAMWLVGVSDLFYTSPLGLGAVFTAYPSWGALVGMNAVVWLAAFCLLIGFMTRASSVLLSLGLMVLVSFRSATGKIDHDVLLVLLPLLMCGSGWGRWLSVDAWLSRERVDAVSSRKSWSLALVALVVALAMSTAALLKVRGGWLGLDKSTSYWHALLNYYVNGRQTWLGDVVVPMGRGWFWELNDWVTILIEIVGLGALLKQRWFTLWCLSLCGFHLGVGLMMDVWFPQNVVVYGVFVPWCAMLVWCGVGAEGVRRVLCWVLGVVVALVLLRGVAAAAGLEREGLLGEVLYYTRTGLVATGFVLSVPYAYLLLRGREEKAEAVV